MDHRKSAGSLFREQNGNIDIVIFANGSDIGAGVSDLRCRITLAKSANFQVADIILRNFRFGSALLGGQPSRFFLYL